MIEVKIPHPGWYESYLDSNLNDAIARFFDVDGDCDPEFLFDSFHWQFHDWDKIREDINEEYVDAFEVLINDILPLDTSQVVFTYTLMESPTYYNYATDCIFANVSEEHVKLLKDYVLNDPERREKLNKRIAEEYTSHDGFISNYENSLTAWLEQEEEWDHNQLSTLIGSILCEEYAEGIHDESFITEMVSELFEAFYSSVSEHVGNWVSNPENKYFEEAVKEDKDRVAELIDGLELKTTCTDGKTTFGAYTEAGELKFQSGIFREAEDFIVKHEAAQLRDLWERG